MGIITGLRIKASNFISKVQRSAVITDDSGKGVKLESDGFLSREFLGGMIGCHIHQTAAQAGGSGVAQFAAELFDTDSMHDNAVNNTRITFNKAGYYLVGGQLGMNATNRMTTRIRLNGVTEIATSSADGYPAPVFASPQVLRYFNAGDYIEMLWEFSSGSYATSGDIKTNMWAIQMAGS